MPFANRALLSHVERWEHPIIKYTARDARVKEYKWENVRQTDVAMPAEGVTGTIRQIQEQWENHQDAIYVFRAGSVYTMQRSRVIGCMPGTYRDDRNAITGHFLRLYLECDPRLLKDLEAFE
jgi:hypothetical protein